MSCELVTGHGSSAHVTAEQFGLLNAALFGSGDYLLDSQDKLEPKIVSANSIEIATGDILMQGRHVTCQSPTTLTITSGTEGYNRIDLVVARYEKNPSNNTEKVTLVVKEGQPTAGTPSVPMHTVGNILTGGSTLHETPLFQVHISGLTPTSITRVLTAMLRPSVDMQEDLASEIDASLIPNLAITASKIANAAVTTSKIAAGAVGSSQLASDSVSSTKIADESITNEKLANASVINSKIADRSITASKIALNSIAGSNIAKGTITKDLLAASALSGINECSKPSEYEYIKFDCGIMICSRTVAASAPIKTKWGSIYCSKHYEMSNVLYPHKFVDTPVVVASANHPDCAAWVLLCNNGAGNNWPDFYLASAGVRDAAPCEVNMIAIGRWK